MSFLANVFDMRRWVPRERRRKSQREVAKGVTGSEAGRPHKRERKYARRRLYRSRMTKAVVDGLRDNPSGSKLLRRFARNMGLAGETGGKPTYLECAAWYMRLEEAPERQGHQGFKIRPTPAGEAVRVVP